MSFGRAPWIFLLGWMVGGWFAFPQASWADAVVFFQEYVLASGETLEGDLVVFGGRAVVQEGARILGNVYVFRGQMVLDGQVLGRMVVMGGRVVLGPTSAVQGTLTALGGRVVQEPGAYVAQFRSPPGYRSSTGPPSPWMRLGDLLWRILTALLQGLALGLVALLVSAYLPQPLRRMGRVLQEQTGMALAVGASSLVLMVLLSIVLAVTLIGLPLALTLVIGLQILRYLAVLVLGHRIALWMAQRVLLPWPEPAWHALGTTATAWALALLSSLGCSGWLLEWTLVSVGVGAVWLSRFGTLDGSPSSRNRPAREDASR